MVASVTFGRDEYDLKPFFYVPLDDLDLIDFRHEVLRDLEDRGSARADRHVRRRDAVGAGRLTQSDKLRHALQKQRWFL